MIFRKGKEIDPKKSVVSLMDTLGAKREGKGVSVRRLENFTYDALGDIGGYMESKEIQKALSKLEKEGSVKTEYHPGKGMETYYYLRGPARRYLLPKWIQKAIASIFALFGLGVIVFSGLSATGNAVLSEMSLPDTGLILSFLLGMIGLGLLVKK